ncbi:MAG: alkaline phosphatase family protein [Thermoanaerobaculia bacterium]|nr:alkaline phosphatase family protein [Thermoanaerobaculia bacterium]
MPRRHPKRGGPLRALPLYLPGAVAGCHFAVLLFFLTPDLSFTPATVLRSVAVFGLSFSIATGIALSILLRRSRAPWGRWLPWLLLAALLAAAGAHWFHAAVFSYYLPPGINNRLIKAAVVISVLGLACFYIALLHTVTRRPYGRASRLAIAVLSIASVLIAIERRSAFPGLRERAGVGALFPGPPVTHLTVVALEGATLDAILPLAEQGRLPFMATLLQQGVHGRLSTVAPVRRLPSWFTVATGNHPYRHGVSSAYALSAPFVSPAASLRLWPWGSGLPHWGLVLGIRPVLAAPQQGNPALWEILQGLGVPTALVGWPADPGHLANESLALADPFFHDSRIPDGSPDQTALARRALELRPTVESVDPDLFTPLGEDLADETRVALVEDLWREAAARRLLADRPDVRALFISLPGLLTASRAYFGGYAATQFDGDTGDEVESASLAVNGYYAFADAVLQRLWDLTPEPRLMVVLSAYGVREPSAPRRFWSAVSGGAAVSGRVDRKSDGALLLLGGHLRSGTFLGQGELVDVAPTILYGLGLPVARDSDGSVLTGAFGASYLTANPLTFLSSYDALERSAEPDILPTPAAKP